jgi:hypothetical protein
MLLTAWGIYKHQHRGSELKLVCTGAPSASMETLVDAVVHMGLADTVIFPGYLPDGDYAALLQSCRALVFPSLYEGFGIPVLEAMAFNKPVLCSNLTSLPEVAGEAALYFDPRKPVEIADAIDHVTSDAKLCALLVKRGCQRLAAFGGLPEMAGAYLRVFEGVVGCVRDFDNAAHGIYSDGWTGGCLTATFGAGAGPRHLELTLTAPAWLPHASVSVLIGRGKRRQLMQVIQRGESTTLRLAIPEKKGFVDLFVDPLFQPKVYGMNDDERWLGCVCDSFLLASPTGRDSLMRLSDV